MEDHESSTFDSIIWNWEGLFGAKCAQRGRRLKYNWFVKNVASSQSLLAAGNMCWSAFGRQILDQAAFLEFSRGVYY